MSTQAINTLAFLVGVASMFAGNSSAAADADVILGELVGPQIYARANGIAAITIGTTSCNAGDKVIEWRPLPGESRMTRPIVADPIRHCQSR